MLIWLLRSGVWSLPTRPDQVWLILHIGKMHTLVRHLLQLNKKRYLEGLPLPIHWGCLQNPAWLSLPSLPQVCYLSTAQTLGDPLTAFVVGKLSCLLLVLRTVTKMAVLRLGT